MGKVLHRIIAFTGFFAIGSLGMIGCLAAPDSTLESGDEPSEPEPVSEDSQALVGTPICYGAVNCVTTPYPAFQWTAVQNAASYKAYFWSYPNGQEVFVGGQAVYGLSTGLGQPLQPHVLYRWKVKGEGSSGADPGPYCAGNVGKYVYYSPYGCY